MERAERSTALAAEVIAKSTTRSTIVVDLARLRVKRIGGVGKNEAAPASAA
jgi:hypothetical protein